MFSIFVPAQADYNSIAFSGGLSECPTTGTFFVYQQPISVASSNAQKTLHV